MKIKILLILFVFFFGISIQAAQPITGLWVARSDTADTYSIICIYEYQGKSHGRVIIIYDNDDIMVESFKNPSLRADKLPGSPYLSGMDIMQNLVNTGEKWTGGTVIDPESGRYYKAEAWRDGENLILRGKWGPFGRNNTWEPFPTAKLPPSILLSDLDFIPKHKNSAKT